MTIDILKPGLLTTVQDRGRIGHAALGIGRSGAMDSNLLRLANALVGNDDAAAGLEITVIGPRLRARRDCTVALCGNFSRARINDLPIGTWRPLPLSAGAVLDCSALTTGMRGYLAIDGGVAVETVLGSRATDVNGRLGPFGGRALQTGDEVPLGTAIPIKHRSNSWSLDPSAWFDVDGGQPIHYMAGSHRDALTEASLQTLERAEFRIGTDSNRIGIRLEGPILQLQSPLELISEAVSFGSMQLPPGGQPIVLMVEHPTTGGYPRIGQIAAIDLGRLAQRRPGERLRLAAISLEQAQARYRRQQDQLGALIRAIHERIRA